MFCTNCGNDIEQHARFCSKCGQEVTAAVPAQLKQQHDMKMHINILAWLFVGCGVLCGLLGIMMIFAGQVIDHLPIAWPAEFPFTMAHFAGWIAGIAGLTTMALAAGIAAAGAGLLQYKGWARVLSIIIAIFLLFKFPVGTAIGVYGLWVLFSQEGQEHYKARAASTMA
jgi:predicted nucleic acid-binding Zn ribbon protein